jgi:hypothetical protein
MYLMTLESQWRNQHLAGIQCVHALLGYDLNVAPKVNMTYETFVQVLQELATGIYNPSNYFTFTQLKHYPLTTEPPRLKTETKYVLVALNGLTTTGEFVSISTGGIIFEEPFWAILASNAIYKTQNPQFALPKARNNEELWNNISDVADRIKHEAFHYQDFFEPIQGFISPATVPRFELLYVNSEQLMALRTDGAQAIGTTTEPKFYELFDQYS